MSSSAPMSTNPEDRIVALLSRWLARHLDNVRLREEIEAVGRDGLNGEQAELLDELLAELAGTPPDGRSALEPLVRETLEALALG
jgi:hypothetical protein